MSSPSPGAFKHSCVEHSEKGLRGLPSTRQVNENAKKDLKEGLLLYNTENNVGLKNAWNIIQAEVRGWAWQGGGVGGRGSDSPWVTEDASGEGHAAEGRRGSRARERERWRVPKWVQGTREDR